MCLIQNTEYRYHFSYQVSSYYPLLKSLSCHPGPSTHIWYSSITGLVWSSAAAPLGQWKFGLLVYEVKQASQFTPLQRNRFFSIDATFFANMWSSRIADDRREESTNYWQTATAGFWQMANGKWQMANTRLILSFRNLEKDLLFDIYSLNHVVSLDLFLVNLILLFPALFHNEAIFHNQCCTVVKGKNCECCQVSLSGHYGCHET